MGFQLPHFKKKALKNSRAMQISQLTGKSSQPSQNHYTHNSTLFWLKYDSLFHKIQTDN